jgi:hypothetical protein
MAFTGMSGINILQHLADPNQSALRVTNQSLDSYTSVWLVSAQNISGTGQGLDARAHGGQGFFMIRSSGNPSTADILGSLDSATWFLATATAMAAGGTATGQWSSYYPYIAGRVTWVSGGTRTASVDVVLALK